eukprot:13284942-Alexandrium_andersonii.AAC.1
MLYRGNKGQDGATLLSAPANTSGLTLALGRCTNLLPLAAAIILREVALKVGRHSQVKQAMRVLCMHAKVCRRIAQCANACVGCGVCVCVHVCACALVPTVLCWCADRTLLASDMHEWLPHDRPTAAFPLGK